MFCGIWVYNVPEKMKMNDPQVQELKMRLINSKTLDEMMFYTQRLKGRLHYLIHSRKCEGSTELIGQEAQGRPRNSPTEKTKD